MTTKSAQFSRDSDLTGLWSGEYWYVGLGMAPVPFSAHLVDVGGTITGTTLEPNTFAHPGLIELSADISGSRGELTVQWNKLYHPAPGVKREPVFYIGTIDPKFTIVDGEWRYAPPGYVPSTGRFILTRLSRGAQAVAKARELELELKR
ncbi:MAG TPA: hypothetical protein VGO52_19775 [Hyphomonadaceae bacterium]|nr:hypothetical protein [Hyphomonadaceae bacterium]